jgi:hypothetical protein
MNGNNYPYKGHKDSAMRGAFANTAIIHSTVIPSSFRGSTYSHMFHITDWLPTIMNLATNGEWDGSYVDADLDGVDHWDSMTTTDSTAPRDEIVFLSHTDDSFVGQLGHMKYIYHLNLSGNSYPDIYFTEDYDSDASYTTCTNPSLVDSSKSVFTKVRSSSAQVYAYVFGGSQDYRMNLSFIFLALIATSIILGVGLLVSYQTTSAKYRQQVPIKESNYRDMI